MSAEGHVRDVADDERISAYLDGELTDDDRRRFEEDVAASPELGAQLRSVGSLRAALRDLPEIAPPVDLVAEGRRRRSAARVRHRSRHALAVLAVAAAWFLVLGFGAGTALPRVVPALDDLVDAHAAAASGAPEGYAEMDMEMMGAEHPEALGDGMELTSVYARGNVVLLSYTDGEHSVSVFEQRGDVDWGGLPGGGEMAPMDGDMMSWTKTMDGTDVVVVDAADMVVTVVADPGTRPVVDMAVSMVEPDAVSVGERLRRAASDVISMFGLG